MARPMERLATVAFIVLQKYNLKKQAGSLQDGRRTRKRLNVVDRSKKFHLLYE